MPAINIPSGQFRMLRKLSEQSDPQFESLLIGLSQIAPSLSGDDFAKRLSALVPTITSDDITDYVRVLFALFPAMENYKKSAKEVATDIRAALKDHGRQDFDEAQISTIEDRIQKLLSVGGAVALAAKAHDISTEHSKVFGAVKIYSDIRPIFSASADSIEGVVVIHNLNISYHNNSEHKEFYVALDGTDLTSLKDAIERAEKKTKQLISMVQKAEISYLH